MKEIIEGAHWLQYSDTSEIPVTVSPVANSRYSCITMNLNYHNMAAILQILIFC